MSEDRYVLNTNVASDDVVHRNPREECNTDDADALERIDAATATALVEHGAAVWCRHCYPDQEVHL